MNYDCVLVILIILIYFSTFKYNCSTFCVRLARIDTLHISIGLVVLEVSTPTSQDTDHTLIPEGNGAMLKVHVYKAHLWAPEGFLGHEL